MKTKSKTSRKRKEEDIFKLLFHISLSLAVTTAVLSILCILNVLFTKYDDYYYEVEEFNIISFILNHYVLVALLVCLLFTFLTHYFYFKWQFYIYKE